MEDKKELIWVDSSQKKIIDSLESDFTKSKYIDEIIESRKRHVKLEIESLDDDLLLFKGFALKYKNELQKIFDSQQEALEEIWDQAQSKQKKVEEKIRALIPVCQKVTSEIGLINKAIENVNVYRLERLMSLLEQFKSMSADDKKMFEILLKQDAK